MVIMVNTFNNQKNSKDLEDNLATIRNRAALYK